MGMCALALLLPAEAGAAPRNGALPLRASESPGTEVAFGLPPSHGYRFRFGAYSDRPDGQGRAYVSVAGKGAVAVYWTEALVTPSHVRANFGSLGMIDVAVLRSGRTKKVKLPCLGARWEFEPGVLEGTIEFQGEDGYADVQASSAHLGPSLGFYCQAGRGYGEVRGPGIPGIRLKGLSFAHGRSLSFQLNKNRPRGHVFYKATLRERRGRVAILRELEGDAPASSLRFDPQLEHVRVSPPAPFSGVGIMSRPKQRLFPRWGGDLTLEFLGHEVHIAGSSVHLSVSHARISFGSHGSASAEFG
jgi:hypothetical protein